jgi:hypothetical protein
VDRNAERNATLGVLKWRTTNRQVPFLNLDSFVYPFGSEEFYADGELDCEIGVVGNVEEDVKKQDRLVVLNNGEGTSFAPSVKVPIVTDIG